MSQFNIGDRVIVSGREYRIVKDRNQKQDRAVPGPYGDGYRIGVSVANEPGADRLAWTIVRKTT